MQRAKRKEKGQIAFESLLILFAILTGAVAITGLYLTTHEESMVFFAAKAELTNQMATKKDESFVLGMDINKIAGVKTLIVSLNKPTDINTILVQAAIEKYAKLKNFPIVIQ